MKSEKWRSDIWISKRGWETISYKKFFANKVILERKNIFEQFVVYFYEFRICPMWSIFQQKYKKKLYVIQCFIIATG